jgi:hypothetical protein
LAKIDYNMKGYYEAKKEVYDTEIDFSKRVDDAT